MQARLAEFIKLHNLFKPEETILIAVSGGVDSMVLSTLFIEAGYHIAIAHCNFALRGKDSTDDEEFVRLFAKSHKVPFHVKKCDTLAYAALNRLSIQEAARDLRYAFFNELAREFNYQFIATAHHADDVMETMLLNLMRGTGIAGLHGIRPLRGNVIRPLLFAEKEDIESFAKEKGIRFRQDVSNYEDKYLRNRLRHEVIPALRSIRSDIVRAFTGTAEAVWSSEQLLEFFLARAGNDLCEKAGARGFKIQISKLLSYPQPQEVLYYILNTIGFNRSQCADIMQSETGAVFHSKEYSLVVNRDDLIISGKSSQMREVSIEIDKPGAYIFGDLRIEFEQIKASAVKFSSDKNSVFVDAEFPFVIRSWEEGDRIKPLGMKGSKLLSDVFIDSHVPLTEKGKIPLLAKDNEIIWVAGFVQSEDFKITPDSEKVLKVTLHSLPD